MGKVRAEERRVEEKHVCEDLKSAQVGLQMDLQDATIQEELDRAHQAVKEFVAIKLIGKCYALKPYG